MSNVFGTFVNKLCEVIFERSIQRCWQRPILINRMEKGGEMKKRILFILFLGSFIFPFHVFAIEFIYIGNQGFRHYSCGVNKRGGKVAIKSDGKNRFWIRSRKYSGILTLPETTEENRYCSGIAGAVRMICNECNMPSEEGDLATKKKRLGLYDANN